MPRSARHARGGRNEPRHIRCGTRASGVARQAIRGRAPRVDGAGAGLVGGPRRTSGAARHACQRNGRGSATLRRGAPLTGVSFAYRWQTARCRARP
eukprot:3339139-Pyramimonas_sp.AAC.1